MQALILYSWPGNIRELQNLIERAVIMSRGPELQLPIRDLSICPTPTQDVGKRLTLEQVERMHILEALKESNWVLSGPKGAATRLGLNRSTLQFLIKKLGIARPSALKSGPDPEQQVPAV
jgi:formate hydrogenlyase transcriptional activator